MAGRTKASVTPRLPIPFEEGTIGRYGDFDLQPFDNLEGHELLQNAWLEQNGYLELETSVLAKADNPAIALDRGYHQFVSRMQQIRGLHNPSRLRTQSAMENIEENAAILLENGVPRSTVNNLREFAIQHAKALGAVK